MMFMSLSSFKDFKGIASCGHQMLDAQIPRVRV